MYEPSGYALSFIRLFDSKENKHNFYRGEHCMEKFCSDLKEFGNEIINYKEKQMISLKNNENESYEKQKECHICKKELL